MSSASKIFLSDLTRPIKICLRNPSDKAGKLSSTPGHTPLRHLHRGSEAIISGSVSVPGRSASMTRVALYTTSPQIGVTDQAFLSWRGESA